MKPAKAAASKTVTLRLDHDTLEQLDQLARETERSKAWLAAQAVKAYIAVSRWQVAAIRDAVKRADRLGARFLSDEDVDAWLATWGGAEERKPPL